MEPVKKLVKQAGVRIDQLREERAKRFGITGVQFSVIDFLANQKNNAASQTAIENEFEIQRSTTTIMLQRMEKRNLIQRIVDPTDKRKKMVQLTEKSLSLVPKIQRTIKNDDLDLLQYFSKEELEITKRVLNFIKKENANE
ncbi:MarR family winged helix-turn-helix transcriptional regulator [Lactobacillus ultunensis]|uniref:Transcriptional regulator, MarR family n=1 Tax=Lactobacillus ultunensis DSM 16047 TaxID=525365 RepID=C2EL16_9LACO|nr:MarR family transcriptional regulator [Lactobacillus ultunensis]EEJ72762.1 transcriptional regulator, MarR family [Lactobacillus ultunensis DSM 16047]KRL83038.1 transcriptional regulator [Lactobacillus ultunensis DSM 16047]QQP29109.1 MarR family transcriptional regulator [Lactobacillus ultunensis]